MSKISKMSMQEIVNTFNLTLREEDIVFFSNSEDTTKEFLEKFNTIPIKLEKLKEFFIKNEKTINKEKMVLLLIYNYKEKINSIKERKKELKTLLEKSKLQNQELVKEFSRINREEHIHSECLKIGMKLAKGMDAVIPFYTYDKKEERYKVKVVDSRDIIDGKQSNSYKNKKRYEEIDEYFRSRSGIENYGIEYILQSILLTDLYEVFPDIIFGNNIRTMILENAILRDKIKTKEELEEIKMTDYDKYIKLVDNTEFISLLPEVNKTLKEYVQYIDIDKLLLISAYRFEEGLEEKTIINEAALTGKVLLSGLLDNIKSDNYKISVTLQKKVNDSFVDNNVEYSVKDIRRCIQKFIDKEYITEEQIEIYKEKVNNKEITLLEMDPRCIDIVYNKQELEEIALLSDENLEYVLERFEWDKQKILDAINAKNGCSTEFLKTIILLEKMDSNDIIKLYLNKKIDINQISELKGIIDLSTNINSYELIQCYKNSIENDFNQVEEEFFDRYLELYKVALIDNKEGEELEENYNKLVNDLLDNFRGEEYIKVAEEYYKKGLLTLDILLDWNEEKIIDRFYKDGIISVDDIKLLVKSNKLPFEYISNMYLALINKEDIGYDERLEYIKTGYISEEEVFKKYNQGLIFDKDLIILAELGIVRLEEAKNIIDNRTMEELEKSSSIKLVGLNDLTKINNDIYAKDNEDKYNTEYTIKNNNSPKSIIDPNRRAEYINMFRARQAKTDLEEESPFYNYEFYVIPDESGTIGLNSVVIAERYYEEKDTEEQFALNNATYFFKYKDLMVLSNLKKSEMTQERENVVFTARHILADENKNGYWAAGVIYGIAKTMLSSDLKGFSKTEQRNKILDKLNEIYTNDEILKILDMASQIDSGEYTYEIQEPKDTYLRKRKKSLNIKNNDMADDGNLR